VTDAAIAGFSLGGLSALDIAWQYPQVFSKVGVFSGSLWWRSRAFRPEDPDADRIAHEMIAQGPYRVDMKFWLQTGTLDETADRNNNGIIDSIDDTLDLIAELETVGYRQGADIRYVEMEGGEHNPHTWGEAMPDFLQWVFS
jgi:enterochelin esterase-like enzyme